MKFGKMHDLSFAIDPQTETRFIKVDYVKLEQYKETFPGYVVTEADKYYPMHTISMASHIGTHLEAPYHWNRKGKDLAELPLEQLVGEAVVLDLTTVPCEQSISKAEVEKAAKLAGMKSGDMVFCHTQYHPDADKKAPFFSTEAVQWLVNQGMSLMAVEAEMEDLLKGEELGDFPNHAALFEKEIPLIEGITNLQALVNKRLWAAALPVKISGLESIAIRMVGIELE